MRPDWLQRANWNYELLRLDDSVRAVIRANGNTDQIRETARSNGMRSMQEDAMEKLRSGSTTLEEILRVVPVESVSHAVCAKCSQHILSAFKVLPLLRDECPRDPRPSAGGHRIQLPKESSIVRENHREDERCDQTRCPLPQLTELSMIYEGATEEVAVRPPDLSPHGMFINTANEFPEGGNPQTAFSTFAHWCHHPDSM